MKCSQNIKKIPQYSLQLRPRSQDAHVPRFHTQGQCCSRRAWADSHLHKVTQSCWAGTCLFWCLPKLPSLARGNCLSAPQRNSKLSPFCCQAVLPWQEQSALRQFAKGLFVFKVFNTTVSCMNLIYQLKQCLWLYLLNFSILQDSVWWSKHKQNAV